MQKSLDPKRYFPPSPYDPQADSAEFGGVPFFQISYLFAAFLPLLIAIGGLFPQKSLLALVGTCLLHALSLLLPRRRDVPPSLSLSLFFATLLVSLPTDSTEAFVRAFFAAVAFSLVRCLPAHREEIFFTVLSLTGGVIGGCALAEKLTGNASVLWMDTTRFSEVGGRAAAFFSNPNLLAMYLVALLPISLSAFLTRARPLLFFSLLLHGGGIVVTLSRVSIVVALLLTLLLLLSAKKRPLRVLALFALLAALTPSHILDRIISIVQRGDSSGLYRLTLWRNVLSLPPRMLLFGVGIGRRAFLSALLPYASAGIEGAEHTHSLYLGVLLSLGVVGLILLLSLLLSLFYRLLCPRTLYARGVLLALVGLALIGFTDDILYDRRTFLLFFYLIGVARAVCHNHKKTKKEHP